MTDREIMQQALTVLKAWDAVAWRTLDTIEGLEAALAQPEPQVCCGDYEKCMKACTPRGRWLAEKELTKSEQKLNDPPAYVEPPTSDYHNGWEEGFEAAKNLFKKESAPQNADPRLLLGRKDNCTALAQPKQESISTNDHLCAMLRQVHDVLACTALPMKRKWQGLTDEEIKGILDCGRGGLVDIKKAEQILKEKNGG